MSSHLDDKCIFCAIINGVNMQYPVWDYLLILYSHVGKIPSFKVYETDLSYAFLDINPVADGHTLVIPKYHAKTILDLPDEHLVDIAPILKKIAKATGAEQFNVLQNNGELAFQTVGHVHFHVIPKPNAEEGIKFNLEENWPAKTVEKDVLAKTAEKIKAALA
ncbi:hypothetical protein D9619_006628 [Psilocybe cf. subviscida]|uniref:HIT domain-containing protein n=1 Tax=Psilocybe cf. subviscida TaxID=2480587 RepID=A0A8H5EXJ6_9AGAR|nr:hypothetical protein D9619_006628 [Psilocybe cf. subviscida]